MDKSTSGRGEGAPGTQVVFRVASVLRAVAQHPDGATTLAVSHAAGLTRPTAHRLLASLAREGFTDHDSARGLWFLGPELYLLGAQAADRYDVSEAARSSVRALARETGESAFFSVRRGDQTVCLLREEGSFPIRSFVLYEGKRFPLGVASAGLAILSHLDEAEVDAYLDRAHLEREWGASHSRAELRDRIALTREAGYAVNPALILEGSWGMGAAVFDATGRPAWALSLTGVESRFRPDRRPELGRLLLDHAHTLTKALRTPHPRG
ncbi:IclR family transcriptional regulator [Herbiconiux moechotypicola]|uniref:IclR family transcriptional regulator n=1 Tax=Herbiconiux moechotypicola TaxID=637393 RepID=A0ABP5QJL8_9MICO|nr:IclR family transcriptional regulator [Herbiconiux moechotypicola]MCS5730043.1 IclR family transcriptional regulator [Herbiconiux moechotypicola]